MHSRENIQASALAARSADANQRAMMKDTRLLTVNGAPQLEYDGLHGGELAWILGRRFKSAIDPNQGAGTEISEYSSSERYTQQAFAGLGSGVDRMQRLASTGWVESLFQERIGNATIALHNIRLDTPYAMAMDSSLEAYKAYIDGATVLQCPDIAWWRARIENTDSAMRKVGGSLATAAANEGRRLQGINIIDTSPFLRGVQVDSSLVRFDGKAVEGVTEPEDMARNIGGNLCMSVLETELRRRNIMDWTPDGIVLSKLESPTDEPMKSTAIDARQAQLFNIGIQGPSITKSWTSDVKDHKLEVQPMDKVFVAVVARLSYRVTTNTSTAFQNLRSAQQAILRNRLKHRQAVKTGEPKAIIDAAVVAIETAKQNVNTAYSAYQTTLAGVGDPKYILDRDAYNTAKAAVDAAGAAATAAQQQALKNAKDALDQNWKMDDAEVTKLLRESTRVRTNQKAVSKAYLTDFRLMRTTSSHMSNYSYFKPGDSNSRLGLPIGSDVNDLNNFSGVQDVIVGAWCIGTVIDSAASRSTIGFQQVKSHPTSMAININVNIQWWSGDKLYKHFHDAGGLTLMRGQKRPLEPGTNVEKQEEDQDKDITPAVLPGDDTNPRISSTAHEDNSAAEVLIPPLEEEDITPDFTRMQRQRTGAVPSAFEASAAASAAAVARARPGQSRRA
tara:strand:- start:51 stop:2072 length:2022 start_codon:yes stop_codon:yes gene_type:complete